ncbi:MAG: peptide ABC transporter permease [Gammaproteobacteria bacterium]|nr:MAG: peptide ABC transporter permease [Gammaproteobacteria bacterium]RTZ74313.1 MAG: peptide ABC transporter permease [Gammaproteobacteria bacterium]
MALRQSLGLATRDYFHEWQISVCFVLALAAVLGPMMVLFGLKFGIVGSMIEELREDPAKREIRPVGSGRYDRAWIESLRKRDDVIFIVPRVRSIAATLEVQSDRANRILPLEVIPSAQGDPLLPPGSAAPKGLGEVVLSASAARKLQVSVGDGVDGSLSRRFQGRKERVHLPLTVVGVAPPRSFSRDGLFASVALSEALEDFRDGRAVPALEWEGEAAEGERHYTGFRLYARSIYDVAGLEEGFERSGIEVRTKAADIETVRRMDRTLSAIYWSIAVIGLAGFSLSLGASLWANVDRKRKELSVLRLVGFRTGDIVWFPVVQSLYTAVLGWALACAIYLAAAWSINLMLAPQLEAAQEVCRLLPRHYLIALGLTLGASVLAAVLAGIRAARVEPSEGLREI